MNARARGQGALEYLLLIGGAVLVGTVVLLIAIGSTSSTTGIINDNLDTFTNELSIHAAFGGGSGGPGPACNNDGIKDASEACDGAQFGTSTCGDYGYSGGSLTCTNCVISTGSCTSPSSPPTATFSMATGTSPNQILTSYDITNNYTSPDTDTYTIFDDVDPTTGPNAITDFTSFNAYCGASSCLFGGVLPFADAPQTQVDIPIPFPAPSATYWGIMMVCNTDTSQCSVTSVDSAVSGASGGGPAYLSNFAVTPQANTAGFANYNYSWTVAGSLPAAYTNPIAGIVPLTSPAAAGLTFDDAPAVTSNFYAARNPVSGTADPLTVSSGSGTGKISNTTIKTLLELFGGSGAFFGIAFEQAALPGKMELFLPTTASSFPADTDAPSSVTLTSGTGTSNGGQISLSFTNPSDQYLGTTYTTPGGILSNPKQHELAWSNTASDFTDFTSFNAIPASQKKVSTNGNTAGASWSDSLNHNNGLVPSSTGHFVGVKVCDQADTITAPISNCYVVSGGPYAASKEANKQETDLGVYDNTKFQAVTTGGETGIRLITAPMPSCVQGVDNITTHATTLNAPTATNTTYRAWVLARNSSGVTQGLRVQIGTNPLITITISDTGGAWQWFSVPANTVVGPGGSVNVITQFPCSTATNTLIHGKTLITSDLTCVPTGSGPTGGDNCI